MDFIERLISFLESHLLLSASFCILLFLCLRYENKRSGPKISCQKLISLMNLKNATLIDTRKQDDFDAGHIIHSLHIPFDQIKTTNLLPKAKDEPIVITCELGHYSSAYALELKKQGYTNVMMLKGGVAQWKSEALPLMPSKQKQKNKNKRKKSDSKKALS